MKIRFGAVVALAVASYFVWSGKAEKQMQAAGEAALADAIKLMSRIELHVEDTQYVDDIVRQVHERAFGLAYSKGLPGGHRRAAKAAAFRQDNYFMWLFHHTIRQVVHDYKDTGDRRKIKRLKGIKRSLEALRDEQGIKKIGI